MISPLALIIEDDPGLGAIYDVVLKQANYDTEVLRRGDEALRRLADVSPAVILLDIHLPYVSGVEIIHYIRSTERLAQTPVIVLTADLYLAQSMEDQADHVLIKSYGVGRLRELIAQLPTTKRPDVPQTPPPPADDPILPT